MPANVYECMFLLDPNKVANDVPNAAKVLHTLIERNKGEILASRPWDERRLAYPIKGHKKGQYYLTYFKTEGPNVSSMEKDFQLNELILRYMVINVNPKLVDIMLTVARDEHALAVQTVTDTGEGDGELGDSGPPSDRPRRGRGGPRGDRGGDKGGDKNSE
jgi:small subunit ribosomal protein S6